MEAKLTFKYDQETDITERCADGYEQSCDEGSVSLPLHAGSLSIA